jgi:hypothetical protein
MRDLSREEADQFAQMILAGAPAATAASYFFGDDTTPDDIAQTAAWWMRKRIVKEAIEHHQGRSWLQMSGEERIKTALDKHYNEMAYYLYSRNYSDLQGADKVKADTAREALEKKLAGTAGATDPLTRFYEDLVAGRVKTAPR